MSQANDFKYNITGHLKGVSCSIYECFLQTAYPCQDFGRINILIMNYLQKQVSFYSRLVVSIDLNVFEISGRIQRFLFIC